MTDHPVAGPGEPRCLRHRGQLRGNCGCCRSEQIADPDAEPENIPAPTVLRRRPFRLPRRAQIRLVDAIAPEEN